MNLRITYNGMLRGKRLYAISIGRECLFVGTLPEVKRYIVVRTEKIQGRADAEAAALADARRAS